MNHPNVIALCGLAGAGKSTVADYLIAHHGYTRVKFADTLKGMLRLLGLNDAHIEGHLKELPCPVLGGQTPRHAMVTLGTEWGRDLIWRDLWVANWLDRASDVLDHGGRVVVDDMRFPNEREFAAKLGAVTIRITRPGQVTGSHQSEAFAASMPTDMEFVNDGQVNDLQSLVDGWLGVKVAA